MPKIEKSGCHGCRYGDWDADGCTCKLDGLLVPDPRIGCKYRKADEDKPMTNGNRIRAMTDEELAYFLTTTSCSICCDHPLNCGFDCASLYAIKAEKTEQVSLLDRLAAEYDRKHPNGLKFVYSLDGETPQTEQEEKENG